MKFSFSILISTLALVGAGCVTISPRLDLVPSYEPSNVFREAGTLPKDIKRVAVLPLTGARDESEMEFGRDSLWPVLVDELGKTRKFELVAVSPEQMRLWTGRTHWTGEEKLPEDFFEKVREPLGCDAVLFCSLTRYRAYPPLAVGWRLKLLETEEPHILWSVDEVFDSSEPSVAAAARRYFRPTRRASLRWRTRNRH